MAKSVSVPSIDAVSLAVSFNQPLDRVNALLEKHGVTALPAVRYAGDGLDAFISDMTAQVNTEPSLTKQEFTESCDPNFILDRVARGQDINLTAKPFYGDFTNVPVDYHTALNIVTKAQQSFGMLDAKIRAKFDNDPSKFMDYLNNPANTEEAIASGLLVAKPSDSSAPAPAPAPAGEGEEGA